MQLFDRLRAKIEGGRVKRCHTVDFIGHYDNAQHSFNMLLIYTTMHPSPQRETMLAILHHDLGERYTGDLPAPSLLEFPSLREGIKEVEAHIRETVGVGYDLSPEEENWLRCVDKIEHWMWAHRQLEMGNTLIRSHIRKLEEIFQGLDMPPQLEQLVAEYDHTQGDDGVPR